MSNDANFVGGMYPKPKHQNAPDFVIGKLSINIQQFREWMQAHIAANPGEEWINIDMKESKGGKGYAQIDDWKPSQGGGMPANAPDPADAHSMGAGGGFQDDDIPF